LIQLSIDGNSEITSFKGAEPEAAPLFHAYPLDIARSIPARLTVDISAPQRSINLAHRWE
jgi:hypothetical protein